MSRLLEKLEEYDETVTVGEIIAKIKKEQKSTEQKDLYEEEHVKVGFENTYLKFTDDNGLFGGKELNIIELKNFVRKERTTDWNFIYYFEGSKISLSETSLHHREFNTDRCGNSFSLKDLNGMSKITKDEYLKYKWEFESIKNQISNLL